MQTKIPKSPTLKATITLFTDDRKCIIITRASLMWAPFPTYKRHNSWCVLFCTQPGNSVHSATHSKFTLNKTLTSLSTVLSVHSTVAGLQYAFTAQAWTVSLGARLLYMKPGKFLGAIVNTCWPKSSVMLDFRDDFSNRNPKHRHSHYKKGTLFFQKTVKLRPFSRPARDVAYAEKDTLLPRNFGRWWQH